MEMKPARLVANGCSYIKSYAIGNGHGDLASQFGIQQYDSLAEYGSCNNRIIRTTLRDSFANTEPTLYVIGMTFLSRYELPVNEERDNLDGKWLSFTTQGSVYPSTAIMDPCVSKKDLESYRDIWLRINIASVDELADDLQYRLISMCDSLYHRGHRCIVFNTADAVLDYVLDQPRLIPLKSQREIIHGLAWRSIPWQFDQGAAWLPNDENLDRNCRHVAPGQHQWLNQYLTNYIQEHKILQ
jgi:hypothetical protein